MKLNEIFQHNSNNLRKYYYFIGLKESTKSNIGLTASTIRSLIKGFFVDKKRSFKLLDAVGEYDGTEQTIIATSFNMLTIEELQNLGDICRQESILSCLQNDKIILDNTLKNYYTIFKGNKFQVVYYESKLVYSNWFLNLKKEDAQNF